MEENYFIVLHLSNYWCNSGACETVKMLSWYMGKTCNEEHKVWFMSFEILLLKYKERVLLLLYFCDFFFYGRKTSIEIKYSLVLSVCHSYRLSRRPKGFFFLPLVNKGWLICDSHAMWDWWNSTVRPSIIWDRRLQLLHPSAHSRTERADFRLHLHQD